MEIEAKEIQVVLLEMMKGFHKACSENGINYYMLGGTCLGAIRHSGFIPWDDDIDVGLPRKDYEKFCRIAGDILPSNLVLRYYKNTNNSPFHFVKLINKDTTLIEKNYKDYLEGVYIDVFPLDGLEKFSFPQKIRAKTIRFLHVLIMDFYFTGTKSGLKNLLLKVSKKMNMIKIHSKIDKLMTKDKSDQPEYYCNFLGAWKDREIIKRDVFGNPTLYSFEDSEFYGPENADAYLRSLYNDYMVLPPVEKQVSRHDYYFVDLDLPFTKYGE